MRVRTCARVAKRGAQNAMTNSRNGTQLAFYAVRTGIVLVLCMLAAVAACMPRKVRHLYAHAMRSGECRVYGVRVRPCVCRANVCACMLHAGVVMYIYATV